MPLSPVMMNKIAFTGSPDQRDGGSVEDAAAVTGVTGAVVAAKGKGAFSAFKSSSQLRSGLHTAAQTTEVMTRPVNQSKSLWNALKLNTQRLRASIANWAKTSKLPKFMKTMLTGKVGKAVGGLAAVFVFVTGISEVVRTALYDLDKINTKNAQVEYSYRRAA